VVDGVAGEISAKHGAAAVELDGDAGIAGGLAEAGLKSAAEGFELSVGVGAAEFLEGGDAGGEGDRVAAQGAGLVNRADGSDEIHDISPASESAHWQASANHFAETTQVGRDPEAFLRAALSQAKAGHYFVEDQQRLVGLGDFPEEFQISGFGQIEAGVSGDGFDNDSGNLRGIR